MATPNTLDDSPLHKAIYNNDLQQLQELIQGKDSQGMLPLLMHRNINGVSPLDEAIDQSSLPMVRLLIETLASDDDKRLVLESRNNRNQKGSRGTALHRAVTTNQRGIVKYLLESVRPSMRTKLATIADASGWSILRRSLVRLNDHDLFKCILNSLALADRVSLLKSQRAKDGETILHYMILNGYIDTLEAIIPNERPSDRLELLILKDAEGRTLLHVATRTPNVDMVRRLLRLLPDAARYNLISSRDNRGQTALHYAARLNDNFNDNGSRLPGLPINDNNSNVVRCILAHIPIDQRLFVLQLQDCEGNTALHEADRLRNTVSISIIMSSVAPLGQAALLAIKNNRSRTPCNNWRIINNYLSALPVTPETESIRTMTPVSVDESSSVEVSGIDGIKPGILLDPAEIPFGRGYSDADTGSCEERGAHINNSFSNLELSLGVGVEMFPLKEDEESYTSATAEVEERIELLKDDNPRDSNLSSFCYDETTRSSQNPYSMRLHIDESPESIISDMTMMQSSADSFDGNGEAGGFFTLRGPGEEHTSN